MRVTTVRRCLRQKVRRIWLAGPISILGKQVWCHQIIMKCLETTLRHTQLMHNIQSSNQTWEIGEIKKDQMVTWICSRNLGTTFITGWKIVISRRINQVKKIITKKFTRQHRQPMKRPHKFIKWQRIKINWSLQFPRHKLVGVLMNRRTRYLAQIARASTKMVSLSTKVEFANDASKTYLWVKANLGVIKHIRTKAAILQTMEKRRTPLVLKKRPKQNSKSIWWFKWGNQKTSFRIKCWYNF